MTPETILIKTEKGQDEIDTRRHKLAFRPRTLLITIDGAKTVGHLNRGYAKLGDVAAILRKLIDGGFVRSLDDTPLSATLQDGAGVDPADLALAKRYLTDFAQSALGGMGGEELTTKIRASHTAAEIEGIVDVCTGLAASVGGHRKAKKFAAEIEDILHPTR